MLDYLHFRYRRLIRSVQRQTRKLRRDVGLYIDKHIWGKWHQLRVIRKLLILWWGLAIIILIGLSQQLGNINRLADILLPVSGGIYSEAEVGSVRTLNPILPEISVSNDINKLIFSGLTKYNGSRHIVGDLASSWDVSADGKTYTFHLRKNALWHDNVPVTSDDVLFTIAAIQNPDTRSPLASSWKSVQVTAPNPSTVVFTIPSPLSSFIDSTTVGLIPNHLLSSTDPQAMRLAPFNQNPIGTGPFKIKDFQISAGEINLTANKSYYGGAPRLDGVTFKLYSSNQDSLLAYSKHQVVGVAGISPDQINQASRIDGLTINKLSLPDEQVLFFRQGDPLASNADIKRVLINSLDQGKISQVATDGASKVLNQPILPGQIGYTEKHLKPHISISTANKTLDDLGWSKGRSGVREKNGQKLEFNLVTLDNPELLKASNEISRQWDAIGVKLNIKPVSLEQLEQSYIRPRAYQLLLYGINIGADPDVYAYWDSSQVNDPGLNLSQYKSSSSDLALESGRILNNSQERAIKYDSFLSAWDSDQPAAILYEPVYIYCQSTNVVGFNAKDVVEPSDRFYNINSWTVNNIFIRRGSKK